MEERKILPHSISSHQKELSQNLDRFVTSEGAVLPKKSQRQLSSSSSSDTRASSVSNKKIKPESSLSKKTKTTISKRTQNENKNLVQKQPKTQESKSRTSSPKSSQLMISDAKESRIIDETKHPDSVWSSLLSNFGLSPDKIPAPLPACPEIPPGL